MEVAGWGSRGCRRLASGLPARTGQLKQFVEGLKEVAERTPQRRAENRDAIYGGGGLTACKGLLFPKNNAYVVHVVGTSELRRSSYSYSDEGITGGTCL